MTKRLYIETVGCQMNVLDSELVIGALRKKGYDLTDTLHDADVILFNTCSVREHAEHKTYSALGRVIPHKVYQGLAAGRAVLTGDGPGLREVFEPGRHLCAVPRGDAGALAAALSRLVRDAALRERLGNCGRARALEIATPERIGASLRSAVEGMEVTH